MKGSERSGVWLELALRSQLDNALDDLIRRAERLIDETKIASEDSGLEERQIKNVLSVSTETDSIEAVKNFVMYQIGRADPNKGWRFNNFGDQILKTIEALGSDAEKIAKTANVEKGKVWIMLVRQYLGYMSRYFVYRRGRS